MQGLLIALVAFAYFTIVLGSWVRNAGAGLSCPDWPLCHGQIIPPMEYRIMLEYFHRLAAAGVSLLLLVTCFLILRDPRRRREYGKWLTVSALLLVVQIILGKLTVDKLLQWEVVAMHLGVAMLFLSSLVIMALKARTIQSNLGIAKITPSTVRPKYLRWLALATGLVVYGQVLLGGSVSSNYAGLACPDFPTCHGDWWPGFGGLVGLQFAHRLGAVVATVFILILLFGWRKTVLNSGFSGGARDLRQKISPWILLLLAVQWTLGIAMVLVGAQSDMQIPILFSVAHLAVGALLFVLVIAATYELQPRFLS